MSTSPATSGSMIQKPGTFVLICFGLFALVVGITVLAMTLFPANPSSAHQRVAHFEGEGDGKTGSFVVDDEWEFRWEHDGDLKAILWTRSDGQEESFIEMPCKPIRHQGGVDNTEGGEYTFEVKGTGSWKIDVYQF